jgi:hypothetical protein
VHATDIVTATFQLGAERSQGFKASTTRTSVYCESVLEILEHDLKLDEVDSAQHERKAAPR